MESRKKKHVRKTVTYNQNRKGERKSALTITRNVLGDNTSQRVKMKKKSDTSNSVAFSIYPTEENYLIEEKQNKSKDLVDRYCGSYLTKVNRYLKASEYHFSTGHFEGLKYHVTLTVNPACKKSERLGKSPVSLSKKIKTIMDRYNLAGFGVLEKGDNDTGILHAHLMVDKFSVEMWPYGFSTIKRIKPGSNKVAAYAKKTFKPAMAEKRSAYFSPRKQKVVIQSDYEYFSALAKSGAKEVKLFASEEMKRLKKEFDKSCEVTEEVFSAADISEQGFKYSERMYFLLIQSVRDIFSFYRNWKQEGVPYADCQYIVALGFKQFAKQVRIKNHGTNGYTVQYLPSVKLSKDINTLWKCISNEEHTFSKKLRREFLKEYNRFEDYVECRASNGSPLL